GIYKTVYADDYCSQMNNETKTKFTARLLTSKISSQKLRNHDNKQRNKKSPDHHHHKSFDL
ncbi:MAG: hypothetical protein ACI90V_008263, partial [Bacillariaceae sp.]